MTDLAVFYEHPAWFEPLFAALDRRGLDWTRIHAGDHVFDAGPGEPPAKVILNRVGMSAFLREREHPIFYAQTLFDHWQGQGAEVVNGPALHIDTSKARQISLIRRLGFGAPETRVVHRAADLPKAAATLTFPVLVKPDIGGSGAGIRQFDTPGELADAVADGTVEMGINSCALVQEYTPPRGGRIVRVETLNGRFLYACSVETGGFDLCLADVCMIAPGKASLQIEGVTPPAEVIAAAEAIAGAAHIDVGGVEYLVDDRDGSVKFYDINALSNFVADPVSVVGFDPHDNLIDYLVERLGKTGS
ncbi:MAG: alpha-L-glutamate ligase [Brevundimonas sp.]|nr:MAG: alpha-L-glutamate ligase [Brevundimonas sp.]